MSSPMDLLTPSERATVDAMCSGNSAKEVARQLNLSYRTIEANMHKAMKRSGLRNRVQLLLAWDRHIRPGQA